MTQDYCPHCGVTRAELTNDQPCWNCGRLPAEQSEMTKKQKRRAMTRRQCLLLFTGFAGVLFLAGILIAILVNRQADEDDNRPVIVVTATSTHPGVITATDSPIEVTSQPFGGELETPTTTLPPENTPTFPGPTSTATLIPSVTAAPTLTVPPEIFNCPNAPSPQLLLNVGGIVQAQSGVPLSETPGSNAFIIRPLPFETTFTTLRGPNCIDDRVWWFVELKDGTTGWIPETINGVHVVQAIILTQ